MKGTHGTLFHGSVESKSKTDYITESLNIVRQVSKAFESIEGAFHFSPVRVTENGRKAGYGICYWGGKDGKKLCLVSVAKVCRTVRRYEERTHEHKDENWWIVGVPD